MSEPSKTVIHVTHEAARKVGGIGTVLAYGLPDLALGMVHGLFAGLPSVDSDQAARLLVESVGAVAPRILLLGGLVALLVHALAASGNREEALSALSRLEDRARQQPVAPDYLALAHTGLGDIDRAFECLENALEERCWYLAFLKVDPAFAPLRSDPRYSELLTRIGLDRTPLPASTDSS